MVFCFPNLYDLRRNRDDIVCTRLALLPRKLLRDGRNCTLKGRGNRVLSTTSRTVKVGLSTFFLWSLVSGSVTLPLGTPTVCSEEDSGVISLGSENSVDRRLLLPFTSGSGSILGCYIFPTVSSDSVFGRFLSRTFVIISQVCWRTLLMYLNTFSHCTSINIGRNIYFLIFCRFELRSSTQSYFLHAKPPPFILSVTTLLTVSLVSSSAPTSTRVLSSPLPDSSQNFPR